MNVFNSEQFKQKQVKLHISWHACNPAPEFYNARDIPSTAFLGTLGDGLFS